MFSNHFTAKKIENRSIFGEDMEKKLCGLLFGPPCRKTL